VTSESASLFIIVQRTATIVAALVAFTAPNHPADRIASAELTEDGSAVVLKIGETERRIESPEGYSSSDLVLSEDRNHAFFRVDRLADRGGKFWEDVHHFDVQAFLKAPKTYQPSKIKLRTNLDQPRIKQIHASSADGKRLLVTLHWCYLRTPTSQHYKTYPYFLDTSSGALAEVKP